MFIYGVFLVFWLVNLVYVIGIGFFVFFDFMFIGFVVMGVFFFIFFFGIGSLFLFLFMVY